MLEDQGEWLAEQLRILKSLPGAAFWNFGGSALAFIHWQLKQKSKSWSFHLILPSSVFARTSYISWTKSCHEGFVLVFYETYHNLHMFELRGGSRLFTRLTQRFTPRTRRRQRDWGCGEEAVTGKYYIPRFWRVVGGHQTSVEPKDQEGMHACMHACRQAGRQACLGFRRCHSTMFTVIEIELTIQGRSDIVVQTS